MTLLEKFQEYRRLKAEVLEGLGVDCFEDIEDHTDEYFQISHGTVHFDTDPFDNEECEATYSEEIRGTPVCKDGLVFVNVWLSTGDKTAMLFDASKEIK